MCSKIRRPFNTRARRIIFNFNLHITNICRSAANQLNALNPLVWMFSSAKSLNKIESLQKKSSSLPL